jgi:hypothetical protein
MNRGALANLILGGVIALLPLFLKISAYDLGRTSKDNLLLVVLVAVMAILPGRKRSLPGTLWALIAYVLLNIVINQCNPASVIVIMQAIYIAVAMTFFVVFYERFDDGSTHYILDGMAIGCIIQSILGIGNHFGISFYQEAIFLFDSDLEYISNFKNNHAIGSLGNTNLFGSYVAISAMTLLRPGWVWFVGLPVLALLSSRSMMGLGAFVAGLGYLINHHFQLLKKWQVYISAIVAMITVYFTGLGGLDSSRFGVWRKNFEVVDLGHFLFGKGPGWFPLQRFMISDGLMGQEHSGFISIFNVAGITAFALVLPAFIRFLKAKDESPAIPAALFAAFCSSYGHFTLHQSTVVNHDHHSGRNLHGQGEQ